MPEFSEQEIIKLILFDKEKAFRLIVKNYSERLYRHIRNIVISHTDTDDVLQETLIKVWKALETFRSDAKLYTWLYRIATNESLNFLKAKKRRFFLPLGDVQEYLLNNLKADMYFSGDEIQLALQKALIQLPEKQRIVFNMKYFEDLKYSEIAKILNLTEGGLKANYHHAVTKIKLFLKNNQD